MPPRPRWLLTTTFHPSFASLKARCLIYYEKGIKKKVSSKQKQPIKEECREER